MTNEILIRERLEKIVDNYRKYTTGGYREEYKLGLLLSGGLDSASIACLLLKAGVKFKAFGANLQPEEREWVDAIKKMYPILDFTEFDYTYIDVFSELREYFMFIDLTPIKSGSYLMQYLLMRDIRNNIDKLIICQFSDEIFGGYNHFLVARAKDDFKQHKYLDCLVNLLAYRNRLKNINDTGTYRKIVMNWKKFESLKRAIGCSWNNAERLAMVEQKCADYFEYDLLFPYRELDMTDIELSDNETVKSGQTKIVLRNAMRGIVPDIILNSNVKYSFFACDNEWLKHPEVFKHLFYSDLYWDFYRNDNYRYYPELWIELSKIVKERM